MLYLQVLDTMARHLVLKRCKRPFLRSQHSYCWTVLRWLTTTNHKNNKDDDSLLSIETKALVDQLLLVRDKEEVASWKHRAALSKAITLVESRSQEKQIQASALLTQLLQRHRDKDHFRIGM